VCTLPVFDIELARRNFLAKREQRRGKEERIRERERETKTFFLSFFLS